MAKSKTITCYVCSNEMKESEAQYNSVDPNELQPICPKCVAEHPFLVDEMNNHESPVVNIIQRYAGLNSKNCPVWIDTAFPTLAEANSKCPDHSYRSIQTTPSSDAPTYWADAHTVSLKPCCSKHAA